MNIKLAADIITDSIVDGPGLRTTVFCQGCTWNCIGCHNPDTHDPRGGLEKNIDELVKEILEVEMQSGITLSGGDPFAQPEACIELTKKLKVYNINIWCYTGFLYEDIIKNSKLICLLNNIDVLIDGPFIQGLKSYDVQFRGSKNQRIINVQDSLKKDKIILWNEAI